MKALGISVLCVAFASLGAGCGGEPPLQRVDGSIVLVLDEGYEGDSTCSGIGPWERHREGHELRMQEGKSKTAVPIDTAVYSEGRVTSDGCEFTFHFDIRKGFEEYTVLDCADEERTDCNNYGFTWEELRADNFAFEWCLGCGGGGLEGGSNVGGRNDGIAGG